MADLENQYWVIKWNKVKTLEIALIAFSNCGPVNILAYSGKPDDATASGGRSYNFNADPFFRRNNNYFASGSLTVRPTEAVNTVIIVTFSNMFPSEEGPKATNCSLELMFTSEVELSNPKGVINIVGNLATNHTNRSTSGSVKSNQSQSIVITVEPL